MTDVNTARVPEQRKTILICDERAVTGRVLTEQLTGNGSYLQVISAVRDAAAVVDAFTQHPTDVVLIGIRRGAPSGPQAVDALLTEHPTAPVIVFGTVAATPLLTRLILRGAQGFMVWDIRQPASPRANFTRIAATAVPQPTTAPKALTQTEQRVLRGIGLGLTNREIGRRLPFLRPSSKHDPAESSGNSVPATGHTPLPSDSAMGCSPESATGPARRPAAGGTSHPSADLFSPQCRPLLSSSK